MCWVLRRCAWWWGICMWIAYVMFLLSRTILIHVLNWLSVPKVRMSYWVEKFNWLPFISSSTSAHFCFICPDCLLCYRLRFSHGCSQSKMFQSQRIKWLMKWNSMPFIFTLNLCTTGKGILAYYLHSWTIKCSKSRHFGPLPFVSLAFQYFEYFIPKGDFNMVFNMRPKLCL